MPPYESEISGSNQGERQLTMENDMEDKYLKLIEALAEKSGTTSEHLYGVLVKQAPITGVVDILQCIAIVT